MSFSAPFFDNSPWLTRPREEWKADWIWCPGLEGENVWAFFRREFDSSGGTLRLSISADSFYWLYVDGKWEGRGPSRAHLDFYTYDEQEFEIAPGRHCLAVLVHHIGKVNAMMMTGRPGVLVEAVLQERSGSRDLSSGVEWKCEPAWAWKRDLPDMMSHFGFWEDCDLSKLPADWTLAGFDDTAWNVPEIVGHPPCDPWTHLCPRDIATPEIRCLEPRRIVSAGSWTEGPDDPFPSKQVASRARVFFQGVTNLPWGSEPPIREGGRFLVVDFGRCLSGYVELELSTCSPGQQIDLSYDDLLTVDGTINPERSYAHLTDRFHLAGGPCSIRTAHPRGFRYLLIDVQGTGEFRIASLSALEENYPFCLIPRNFGDPWLNRLYEKSAETLRVCTTDAFTDCASRERVQWTQDNYLANRVAFFAFGDTAMMRRAVFQAAQNALPDGRINGFFPSERTNCAFASSSLLWLHQLVDYQELADPDDLQRLLPTARRLLDFLRSLQDSEGLISGWPAGQFWDWAPIEDSGCLLITNAVYQWALARLSVHPAFCEHLETPDFARLPLLRQATNARFWDPDRKLYRDAIPDSGLSAIYSQQANIMAALSGICPAHESRALLLRIINPGILGPVPVGEQIMDRENRPSPEKLIPLGTLWFAHFLCEALFESGLPDEALDQMRRLWSVYDDLPNLPETRIQHGNTTLCHAWSAGPAYLLPKYHPASGMTSEDAVTSRQPMRSATSLKTASSRSRKYEAVESTILSSSAGSGRPYIAG